MHFGIPEYLYNFPNLSTLMQGSLLYITPVSQVIQSIEANIMMLLV
jgi:hypothetical protein